MEPSRSVFRGLWRLWQALRAPEVPLARQAARLHALQPRLRMLASCMLGEVVEVAASAGFGGMFGYTLLLSEHIDACADRERNEQVYLQRVLLHARCAELGIVLPDEPTTQPAALLLLMAARTAHESLERDFPGARAQRLLLGPELCARRPRPHVSNPGGVLEGLTQFVLCDANPWQSSLPSNLEAWWASATGALPDAARLAERSRELYAELLRALPGAVGEVPEPVVLWGRLVGPAARGGAGEAPAGSAEPRVQPMQVVTLRRAIQLQRRKAPRREDRPLYHAFEKIETAEDYAGESGTPDAEQDVASMQEALEDLTFATAIRTQERPVDLVRAEVVAEPAGLEIEEDAAQAHAQTFRYPEWDYRKKQLREDYCTVFQERLTRPAGDQAGALRAQDIVRRHKRHIEDIRMHLMRSLYRRTQHNRQLDGPEIDVEAMVERHAGLDARQNPRERLFLSARKTSREFAVVLLLDTSFSTDAWIAGRRILDVEIESLIVLASALEGYVEEEVLVATFHSQTRNSVRFGVVKDFEQSWREARSLAPSLEPQGYTRIGAAVRHASALLRATDARHKLLLLVSDGKPTDFDRYEGNYGIEDIAHAVREAAGYSIQTFGLAIEQEAKLYLARMLGAGRYRILPRTERLPDVMAEVFLAMME